MTVTIRVLPGDRDTLNRWCVSRGCDMPALVRDMVEYGVRRRQQAFYATLPAPSKFAVPVRRKESRRYGHCIRKAVASCG